MRPGADAEANSNVLHGRPKSGDPLVALAEQAVSHSTPAETTMELLIPAQADPPESERTHPQAADGEAHNSAEGEAEAEHTRTPDVEEPVTAKGLPKRTPKITAPADPPRRRASSVDAEALRRRLGGFRQGATAGYRAVEAEIAEQTAQNQAPSTATAVSEEATGGTVEEASS